MSDVTNSNVLEVRRLNKRFGDVHAVRDLNFDVRKGEVFGFLGPNGAGKTTTMRIVTCFIPASSGEISVSGYNSRENSMEIRRMIGYLPESNPLYNDMLVHEYLHLVGEVRGLKGSQLDKRMDEMYQVCGLTKMTRRQIGTLSKGYRQRVGLAQAMLHNPDLLILDEPTNDLDIFTLMSGHTYDDLLPTTATHEVEGVPVRHLSAEGLIRLKADSLRPKDQLDVAALRAIQRGEARRDEQALAGSAQMRVPVPGARPNLVGPPALVGAIVQTVDQAAVAARAREEAHQPAESLSLRSANRPPAAGAASVVIDLKTHHAFEIQNRAIDVEERVTLGRHRRFSPLGLRLELHA